MPLKHEYLREEDYYETNSVGTKARSDKWCSHCGKVIKQGIPHLVAKFYPEFTSYPLHNECESDFLDSLITSTDDALEDELKL